MEDLGQLRDRQVGPTATLLGVLGAGHEAGCAHYAEVTLSHSSGFRGSQGGVLWAEEGWLEQ